MLVSIGSRNPAKVSAVTTAFSAYPELWFQQDCPELRFVLLPRTPDTTTDVDTVSGVSRHPVTLDETIQGATNRAREAFNFATSSYGKCHFAIGLEAGIFPVSAVNSGHLNVSFAVIHDGDGFFYGGSPLFEYPKAVTRRVLDGEEAGHIADFFGNDAKGRAGVIGPLTDGRIARDSFDSLAVLMALTQVVRKNLYAR